MPERPSPVYQSLTARHTSEQRAKKQRAKLARAEAQWVLHSGSTSKTIVYEAYDTGTMVIDPNTMKERPMPARYKIAQEYGSGSLVEYSIKLTAYPNSDYYSHHLTWETWCKHTTDDPMQAMRELRSLAPSGYRLSTEQSSHWEHVTSGILFQVHDEALAVAKVMAKRIKGKPL